MTAEGRLAEHVAGLRFGDLPAPVRASVDRLLLDTLAAMLSGVSNAECRAVGAGLLPAGAAGRSSVIGHPGRTSADRAALVNGIHAHWCEWDDVHDAAGIHGSAVIFPAVLAVAEEAGTDRGAHAGQEFVAAVVAAYDVAARIGEALNARANHGWMTTGAAASIGAAAGAARMMGLDSSGILSAMGIAAAGGGLSRQALADRVNGKNALCGMAAKNAVDAAVMARAGIAGAPNFFAGPFGIGVLHAQGQADLAPLLGDLGSRFSIGEAGLKPYPSCRSTHPSIDLALDLLSEHPGIGHAVESVDFVVPGLPYALCGRPFAPGDNPRVSAQFSIPFTTALALATGAITPQDFLPERVRDFAAQQGGLIGRIVVTRAGEPAPGSGVVPVTGRFRLADGQVIERRTDRIKGSPQRRMTLQEEQAKLRAAAAGVLAPDELDDLREAVAASHDSGPAGVMGFLRRSGPAPSEGTSPTG